MSAPEIVAVLVIPVEGDPGGLLAEGPCYAWPPRVGLAHEWAPMTWDEQGAYDTEALPLWWDGALVPEGWDRARRVYAMRHYDDRGCQTWDPRLDGGPLWLAEELVYVGLASRVVRLARVDGRLVGVP